MCVIKILLNNMPKCKYKNYCLFLEPYFKVSTSKNEFYETETTFVCNSKGHVNRLNINSFGNKKCKTKIEDFCQGCKEQHENKQQTETFCNDVFARFGHTVLDVDFSSRKVHYQCGNCHSINASFTQNFKDSTSFCSNCQNDKYKIPFETLKEKVESHGFTLLTQECEYQNNKMKLKLLCVCGKPYESVLSDIVRDKNCEDCKIKKFETTCMERYGVRNVSQDPTIFERIISRSYLRKNYVMPSGKIAIIQGYEGYAIGDLLREKVEEDDIIFGKDIPRFNYIDDQGIYRTYHPDLFVKSQNRIIEVKSDYTYLLAVRTNELKFRKVIESGYTLRVMIYGEKGSTIKDVVIHSCQQLNKNLLSND